MRAWVLHDAAPVESRPLRFEDVPTPVPRSNEALIKVNACGVCRTDLHVVEGELDQTRQKRPVIPGHQVVGRIESLPQHTKGLMKGDRVGVGWLNCTCGACKFCTSARENLCDNPEFTGWTRDGGYAEYITAPVDFIYPLRTVLHDVQVAPLLCAGIIGYRCLEHCGLADWNGAKIGFYGFGAAAHIAIQIARARGALVYAFSRDRERHHTLAREQGARWVGGPLDMPPVKLDAAIIFAPAGEIVPAALQALDKGGTLVLGGIHMSDIPPLKYDWLYQERVIRSIANNTRADGRAFLEEADRIALKTSVQTYPFAKADEALIALKQDAVKGAAVVTM